MPPTRRDPVDGVPVLVGVVVEELAEILSLSDDDVLTPPAFVGGSGLILALGRSGSTLAVAAHQEVGNSGRFADGMRIGRKLAGAAIHE